MPWGNRSVILRDPDGGLVNLFTPVTPEAKAKYGLWPIPGGCHHHGRHPPTGNALERGANHRASQNSTSRACCPATPARGHRPADAKAHRAVSLWPAARLVLPDRDVLRPAVFSQIHDQPNTDSALCAGFELRRNCW